MIPIRIPEKGISLRHVCILLASLSLLSQAGISQTCPASGTTSVAAGSNTYYPATSASLVAGNTSITLGAATSGATPISAWDVVLIIQMQGTQINANNAAAYGGAAGTGRGYLNNASLLAGNMEFAIATSSVPLAGGTLTIQSGLANSYRNTNFGATGQYRYQVIRVPVYYNATLTGTITAPAWNGTAGGVIVLCATNTLNMNGQTINATGKGFRGGGGMNHSPGTAGTFTDYRALSTTNTCASKGEGIAGTPRFIYTLGSGSILDYGAALEGYPNGSFDRGAPGNAGGGATDGDPVTNSNNAGGGGGGNMGIGGTGGNSWSSNRASGGFGGAAFAQVSASRVVMGGGGGAGSSDGGTGTPANGLASSGAAGGGIVIIRAGGISGTGTINANGDAPNATLLNDGSGGGGAGGSVLLVSASGLTGITVHANGSAGASNTGGGAPHGPGGGGAGGAIYSIGAINAASTATAGAGGTTAGGISYGATAGAAGTQQVVAISQTPGFPLICNTLLTTGFSSVTAQATNDGITINWQMDNDAAAVNYTIEKSFDGIVFSVGGNIARGKNTSEDNSYTFKDIPAGYGHPTVYYRVRCMLTGGLNVLSKVIPVNDMTSSRQLTVSPNPAVFGTTVHYFATRNGQLSIRLVNMPGNTVLAKQYTVHEGANSISIPDLQVLPGGVYLLQTDDGTNHENIKLVLAH